MPSGNITLKVKHNIEVAHRLYTLPGKCQQIHGHGMWVVLRIETQFGAEESYALGADGTPLEFGAIKKAFREYLDTTWDHHLHLNEADPLAATLQTAVRSESGQFTDEGQWVGELPGLVAWPGDPSTENIARWIMEECLKMFPGLVAWVEIEETRTNGVEYYGA